MSKFDDFIAAVEDGAKELAKETIDDYIAEAKQDSDAFLNKLKDDLRKWTLQLANNELSKQDFKDLVQAKEALAEIHALTQKGITLARLERFRSGLIELVINTAFDVFL